MPVSKLLKLPYGSYLMVRLDYKIICADELEAKIMRIIEMYMDDERKILYKQFLNDPKNTIEPEATVEITKDVWPAISHRLFKNDLYDQDMSENTLKRALKSLRKKNFILVRDKGLTRYEAPKYQINVDAVQEQLDLLSRIGKTEYQKLMVSKIDGIKNASHQKETPSDHQNLTASSDSRVSKIDGNSRRVYEVEDTEEESTYPQPELHADESGSVEPTRTFAFQVQGFSHFYHDYCIHAQDRGINDGLTLVVKNLADVPADAECSICYKPVHGPHGYGESLEKGTTNGRSDDNDHLLSGHDRRDTSAVRGAEPVRVSSQQQTDEHEVHPAEPVAARAGRSTRTDSRVTQAGMVNEKGHDNANTPQQAQQPSGQDRSEKRATPTEQPAGSVAATLSAPVPAGKTAATAQLSTLMASSPQRGAKVSTRSAFVNAPLFGTQKPARPQLTEEGKNVLEWYQIIQACKVRKTDATINACNGLGEEDGMSFDNLKKAIEHWEAHSYVKERQIPIDLQKLEDPKGAFTFAKAMLVIRAKPANTARSTALPNLTGISNEEYYASLRRK